MIRRAGAFDYPTCKDVLRARLDEAAPARIQLLVGPRQVGKTTLLLELAEALRPHALYAACDGPEAGLAGFWERLWVRIEEVARTRGRALLLLDEVQYLPGWSARLKGEWDRLRRRRIRVHVVATGSSALRLGAGSRESLAGRFERLTLAHWTPAAIAQVFRVAPQEAVRLHVRMGSYPGAFAYRDQIDRWTAYVRDAIVDAVVGRDLLALAPVRKPALLRQVFAVCTSAPAQVVSLQKIQGRLAEAGALETIAHYLDLLEQAYLVAPIEKHTGRLVRRRSAPPKLVSLSNAFLAAVDPRGVPDPAADPARFGPWVENACLAHAWNSGQRVTYWREEPLEVDGIFEGSWGDWAVEVKTGGVRAGDLRGLLEFTRRFPKYRPLLLGDAGDVQARAVAERAAIACQAWQDFLLEGPPGVASPSGRPGVSAADP